MKYNDFETVISHPRLTRFLLAAGGDKRKALKLYRLNIKLSSKFFAVLSVFEVLLRNKIDLHYKTIFPSINGVQWLQSQSLPGGYLQSPHCFKSLRSVQNAVNTLGNGVSHDKLVAELNFGFWRYQFAPKEFQAAGSSLHTIFTNRPRNTNHTVIFNKLSKINKVRNRVAHHEPVCFGAGNLISSVYAASGYHEIIELISWLGLSPNRVLHGVDHLQKEITQLRSM